MRWLAPTGRRSNDSVSSAPTSPRRQSCSRMARSRRRLGRSRSTGAAGRIRSGYRHEQTRDSGNGAVEIVDVRRAEAAHDGVERLALKQRAEAASSWT